VLAQTSLTDVLACQLCLLGSHTGRRWVMAAQLSKNGAPATLDKLQSNHSTSLRTSNTYSCQVSVGTQHSHNHTETGDASCACDVLSPTGTLSTAAAAPCACYHPLVLHKPSELTMRQWLHAMFRHWHRQCFRPALAQLTSRVCHPVSG
jgi:hypothetical protein